jgi:hypothetical protein
MANTVTSLAAADEFGAERFVHDYNMPWHGHLLQKHEK